jgi:molybdopterin synthase catalytic subunit
MTNKKGNSKGNCNGNSRSLRDDKQEGQTRQQRQRQLQLRLRIMFGDASKKGNGQGDGVMKVEIVDGVIAVEEIVSALKAGADGALCVFDGIVRDNTRGRRTLHLDYEAYREMALEQMRGIAAEAVAKFGVRDVALVHRLGRLVVGETSVLVVVASAHRGAAFDACRWLIDTLKKTVPIWKKEQFVDGAIWADGEPFPEGVGLRRTEESDRSSDDAAISESRYGAPGFHEGDAGSAFSEDIVGGGGERKG